MPPATSPLYDRIAHISQTDCYAICAATALGGWSLWRLAKRCCRWIIRWYVIHMRQLSCYPLPSLFARLDLLTVLEILMVTLLLTVNVVRLAARTRSWADVHRLTFGFLAHLLGVSRSTMAWLHRWIGRLSVIDSILHGTVAVLIDDNPVGAIRRHYIPVLVRSKIPCSTGLRGQTCAIILMRIQAAGAIILIVPVTLQAVVRRHPQLAMKLHYLLGTTGLASLSYHVWMHRSPCLWYLVAAAALWTVLSVAAFAVPLARRWGRTWPSVTITPFHELLHMVVTVPSRWKIEPGQYVYIWLPHPGLRAACQLSLFYVSSWTDTPVLDDVLVQIDTSGNSMDQEDPLSEVQTLLQVGASIYPARQGKGSKPAETVAKRRAAAHPTNQGRTSGETRTLTDATSQRTLHLLARLHRKLPPHSTDCPRHPPEDTRLG
ncbi:hypothetical protein BDV59DRAFT_196607 [Aspergillus ambiguus]|uniref:uncharacterized protein n=1 Tax=Aspergillus ambiguus TaxID=176160 RepID=UPI003CCE4512